jgi:cyclophilin family peptidyl-prolyl cis-trans isomerase
MRTGIFEGVAFCRLARHVHHKTGVRRVFPFALLILCLIGATGTPQASRASQFVELDYNLAAGNRFRTSVFLELFDDKPLTTANFLKYVNATNVSQNVLSNYSGSIMHRLARNFVLQGGGYWPSFVQGAPWATLDPNAIVDLDGNLGTANPTVAGEYNVAPVRSNLAGTISMALSTGPNSATDQWFINLANNSFLDSASSGGPFTVFGQVAGDGMGLINAYNNGVSIGDFNPDSNNNGVQDDPGPFFGSLSQQLDSNGQPTDGVPYVQSGSSKILLVLNRAKQIDYLGPNLQTTVPAAGLTFTSRDAFIDAGTTFTGTGGLGIGAGRTLGVREGVSLGRDLSNDGTLSPGLQLGAITVQDYVQFPDGRLNIQLAGTTVDTQYDRVVATGLAAVNGRLSVSYLGGFSPSVGNSFTFLTASSITGTFSTFDLPELAAGLVWNISKTNTAYMLTIVAADFNRDGVVNAADYTLWRNTFNTSVTPYSGADANGDGFVNDIDYVIWRANLGNVQGTASGAGAGDLGPAGVPEPGSDVLTSVGLLFLAARRWGRPE